VKLESFDEELVFENEYDSDPDYDSEDSNAEEHPNNDYPDEVSSAGSVSDDDVFDGKERISSPTNQTINPNFGFFFFFFFVSEGQ
jgi:hypothetical protein